MCDDAKIEIKASDIPSTSLVSFTTNDNSKHQNNPDKSIYLQEHASSFNNSPNCINITLQLLMIIVAVLTSTFLVELLDAQGIIQQQQWQQPFHPDPNFFPQISLHQSQLVKRLINSTSIQQEKQSQSPINGSNIARRKKGRRKNKQSRLKPPGHSTSFQRIIFPPKGHPAGDPGQMNKSAGKTGDNGKKIKSLHHRRPAVVGKRKRKKGSKQRIQQKEKGIKQQFSTTLLPSTPELSFNSDQSKDVETIFAKANEESIHKNSSNFQINKHPKKSRKHDRTKTSSVNKIPQKHHPLSPNPPGGPIRPPSLPPPPKPPSSSLIVTNSLQKSQIREHANEKLISVAESTPISSLNDLKPKQSFTNLPEARRTSLVAPSTSTPSILMVPTTQFTATTSKTLSPLSSVSIHPEAFGRRPKPASFLPPPPSSASVSSEFVGTTVEQTQPIDDQQSLLESSREKSQHSLMSPIASPQFLTARQQKQQFLVTPSELSFSPKFSNKIEISQHTITASQQHQQQNKVNTASTLQHFEFLKTTTTINPFTISSAQTHQPNFVQQPSSQFFAPINSATQQISHISPSTTSFFTHSTTTSMTTTSSTSTTAMPTTTTHTTPATTPTSTRTMTTTTTTTSSIPSTTTITPLTTTPSTTMPSKKPTTSLAPPPTTSSPSEVIFSTAPPFTSPPIVTNIITTTSPALLTLSETSSVSTGTIASPPSIQPPNKEIVNMLNSADDFMAVARSLRLRERFGRRRAAALLAAAVSKTRLNI